MKGCDSVGIKNDKSRTKIINRRLFLTLMAGGAAGVAGFKFVNLPFGKVLMIRDPAPEWRTYVEKDVFTTCQLCSASCGLKVRTVDGFPVSISGNERHPVNHGGVCPKGLAALQSYYHPARIHQPMLKKDGKFSPISWDEATSLVGQRLASLRTSTGPQDACFIFEGASEVTRQALKKFTDVYGTPNVFAMGSPSASTVNSFCFGEDYYADLNHSRLVLSFGSPLLDASGGAFYAHAELLRKKEFQFIQIEPRRSTSAAKADEWVNLRPGTEGALALGIAHVMIQEKLYDARFVSEHTTGFEGPTGFKQFVLKNYLPATVSTTTGVPVEKIASLAKLLGQIKPSVAIAGSLMMQHSNGVASAVAVNALNALSGSIGSVGGLLKQRKPLVANVGPSAMDNVAKKGLASKRIGLPIPSQEAAPKMLFVYNTNPGYYSPQPEAFKSWMRKIPFVVSFANVWDETANEATLILPEHHFLDRWQDAPQNDPYSFLGMGISQPVSAKPLADTKHIIDILAAIGSKSGEELKGRLSDFKSEELIKSYFEKVYQTQSGSLKAASFADFWKEVIASGGAWSAIKADTASLSRKFNFLSEDPAASVHGYSASTFAGEAKDYPFHLYAYEPISFSGGTGGDMPWLLENPTTFVDARWTTWIEVNPATAKSLGIADGDSVIVESTAGKMTVVAKLVASAQPDIISVPLGLGRRSFSKEVPSAGANAMDVLSPVRDTISGAFALQATRVKVRKS